MLSLFVLVPCPNFVFSVFFIVVGCPRFPVFLINCALHRKKKQGKNRCDILFTSKLLFCLLDTFALSSSGAVAAQDLVFSVFGEDFDDDLLIKFLFFYFSNSPDSDADSSSADVVIIAQREGRRPTATDLAAASFSSSSFSSSASLSSASPSSASASLFESKCDSFISSFSAAN